MLRTTAVIATGRLVALFTFVRHVNVSCYGMESVDMTMVCDLYRVMNSPFELVLSSFCEGDEG
jgi:hypothetical protein